jgi:hypothetical protein
MQAPVDHQHRAGLRGELRREAAAGKFLRLDDAGLGAVDEEHAVGLHAEVAGAIGGGQFFQLLAVLDVQPDR